MDQLPPAAAPPPSHHSGVPVPERQWGMFAHLSAFSACVGIPFGNIVGPLIMFLIKKDEYPFGGDQAKEALNFNISCTLYVLISILELCTLKEVCDEFDYMSLFVSVGFFPEHVNQNIPWYLVISFSKVTA